MTGLYARDVYVFLSPEVILGTTAVPSTGVYGKVTSVEGTIVTCRTRKIPEFPARNVRFDSSKHSPPIVTPQDEKQRLGLFLRKGVLFELDGVFRHGQVMNYHPGKEPWLYVNTAIGEVEMAPEACLVIASPIAMLFWESEIQNTVHTLADVIEFHCVAWDRIKGISDGTLNGTHNVEDILDGMVPVPEVDVIPWLNPITGKDQRCSVKKMIKFVWGEAFSQTPIGMVIFSDDPDYRTSNAETGEEILTPFGPASQPRAGPTYIPILYRPPADKTISDEENEEYQQSQQEFQDYDTYEEIPDNVPDLTPSNPLTPPHLFGQDKFKNSTSAENAQRLRVGPEPSLKALFNPGASPLTQSISKFQHVQGDRQRAMFKTMFQEKYHRVPIMDFLTMISADNRVNFKSYPGVMTRIVDGRHGIANATGYHFRMVKKTILDKWRRTTDWNMTDHGINAKMPKARDLAYINFQDLAACYRNACVFYRHFGSSRIIEFADKASTFINLLDARDTYNLAQVDIIAAFIDNVYQDFYASIYDDLLTGGFTHLDVHWSFNVDSIDLRLDLSAATTNSEHGKRARINSTSDEDVIAKKPKTKVKTKAKTKDSPSSPTSKIMDDPAPENLRHNGVDVCLRFLSKSGCYSKDPTKCTTNKRTHHVPSNPLSPALEKYLERKWGGISTEYPHLRN